MTTPQKAYRLLDPEFDKKRKGDECLQGSGYSEWKTVEVYEGPLSQCWRRQIIRQPDGSWIDAPQKEEWEEVWEKYIKDKSMTPNEETEAQAALKHGYLAAKENK